MLDKTQNL